MKNLILIAILTLAMVQTAQAKTRLSVTAFENKAGGGECYLNWWGNDLGTGMADQLITKLSESDRFEVYERENLGKMYGQEHELINSEEASQPAKKKFKAAQYSIVGAITSFEYCNKGLGGGLNIGQLAGIGDMRIGAKKASAKVVLDMRVIDVESGRVLKSVKATGDAGRLKASVEGDIKGVDFGGDGFYNSPIGEATRDAIANAFDKLAKTIPAK